MCVCVAIGERESARKREIHLCGYVCVCVRERERGERERLCKVMQCDVRCRNTTLGEVELGEVRCSVVRLC